MSKENQWMAMWLAFCLGLAALDTLGKLAKENELTDCRAKLAKEGEK